MIQTLERYRQEEGKLKVSLRNLGRLCLRKIVVKRRGGCVRDINYNSVVECLSQQLGTLEKR